MKPLYVKEGRAAERATPQGARKNHPKQISPLTYTGGGGITTRRSPHITRLGFGPASVGSQTLLIRKDVDLGGHVTCFLERHSVAHSSVKLPNLPGRTLDEDLPTASSASLPQQQLARHGGRVAVPRPENVARLGKRER